MRRALLSVFLVLSGCATTGTGTRTPVPTQQQVYYHAVDCYDGQPAHGGMRVMRFGEDSKCPKRDWLETEWELLQRRLKIDDDLALSGLRLIYYTEGSPCSPIHATSKPVGCFKRAGYGDGPIAFVDQKFTLLSITLKRYPTWPTTTWHEIGHHLMDYYGHSPNHEWRFQVIDGQLKTVYSSRDRYFYESVCKAIGGDTPRLRKPLDQRSPL